VRPSAPAEFGASLCHDCREVTTGEIVGRNDELGYLQAFLDRTDRGLRAVVLEGEAGVGKSTLFAAGVAAAQQRGFQVLFSRPAEAERGLAHVVLADLLDDVVEEVLPTLSPPRRRALEGALLIGRAPEDALDPRTLGVAVRTCLQELAERRPLVLAVDDSQWVDSSSASALAFALRRLRVERIFLLLARRLDEHAGAPGIEESIDSHAVERLRVGPLSIGAMHLLMQRRLGRSFARPTLLRVHEISGGNPFYALELARGLPAAGTTGDPTAPFPVPESLERLVNARLGELGDSGREALLLTAAHGRPSISLLRAAGISLKALDPALVERVVELSADLIRFTHPLLASVLYQGASPDDRRQAHRRLAAVVDDPVERARHFALSSDTPDEDVAAALEEVANVPRSRGTIIAAAELAEHALRLTPSDAVEDRHRRTIAAARAHLDAADTRRARELALDLLARTQVVGRAEALVLLSDVEKVANVERAIELRREALGAAAGLPVLQAEIHMWLGDAVQVTEGAGPADEHAVIAFELAERLGDDALRSAALSVLAVGRFRAGDPEAMQLVEQAQLAAVSVDPRQRRKASFAVVHPLVWSYQLDRARTLLEISNREWSERDELAASEVLWWLGMIELRSGRFPVAAEYAEQAREIVRQYAIDPEEPDDVWLVALVAAHRGELERARALAESSLPLTESQPVLHSGDEAVVGLVELWSGRPGEAMARFEAADEERRVSGVNEPAMFWWRADYVEALLALGRLDEAAALVDAWEADAARLGREAVLAQATRCRGLVAAARGDVEEALAELGRAVEQHEAVGDEFGRARALLALGVVMRRARQKRAAREAIVAALDSFETSGAAGWAEKARAELGTIGGRRRIEGLTPAEGRIATLVGEGKTNREVAAALFLTEQTVATALTRVYRKLGVRSRSELARRLAGQAQESNPAKT
jgi:DNA-binding CsgD family transcriptional regulator